MAHKPANLTFEQAAAVPDGAASALACLRRAGVGPGKHVLVYGASGSIGTATAQLAKHMGARVTAVCETKNVELVRSLGADEVLDYSQVRTSRRTARRTTSSSTRSAALVRRSRHALKRGVQDLHLDLTAAAISPSRRSRGWAAGGWSLPIAARQGRTTSSSSSGLLEAGEYLPVVDRSYRLEDIVDASRYVETQQKTGNVVLTVGGDRKT